MGLFTGLLTLPLAPVRGVMWVAQQIESEVDRQQNDPAVLRQKIDDAERAYEEGEIDADQRDVLQEAALERLTGRDRGIGGG